MIDYQNLWNTMIINPSSVDEIKSIVHQIEKNKTLYEYVSEKIGSKLPWYFIGVIHYMECNCNTNQHLHNGDSLRARTYNVPKGRPIADPQNGKSTSYTFIESAIDALTFQGFTKCEDWSLPVMLEQLEEYNGCGYQKHGINTPYLWAETNHYEKGKFVSDGEFDPEAISKQIGCAPLIRYLTDKTLQ